MNKLPQPGEDAIRKRVGEQVFNLGKRYYNTTALIDAHRQGNGLKVRCTGPNGVLYRVRAVFNDKTIRKAECSCPQGNQGKCKHIVAMLLAWHHQSQTFQELEDIDISLERRSKAELVAIIKEMLRQEPSLENLLDPPASPSGSTAPFLPSEHYRQQAAAMFRSGFEWDGHSSVCPQLQAIKQLGDDALHQKNNPAAAAVFDGLTRAILDHYEPPRDQDGAISGLVKACAQGLGQCLAALGNDPVRRETILKCLVDIYLSDIEQGGVGMSENVPEEILRHATADERRMASGWLRKALPNNQDWSTAWRRQTLGNFLVQLEADLLDDEGFLKLCRETGQRVSLVKRLLVLDRLQEAFSEAEQAKPGILLLLADLLFEHGQEKEAEELVARRIEQKEDVALLKWLKERVAARNRRDETLTICQRIFRLEPTLDGYQEMEKLGEPATWPSLREKQVEWLTKTKRQALLAEIHLHEGDIEAALKIVQAGAGNKSLRLLVSAAAEKNHPRKAIALYSQQVESELAQRNQRNSQELCQYLNKIQQLYERLYDEEEWEQYISRLRERYRHVRVLEEGLKSARLGE